MGGDPLPRLASQVGRPPPSADLGPPPAGPPAPRTRPGRPVCPLLLSERWSFIVTVLIYEFFYLRRQPRPPAPGRHGPARQLHTRLPHLWPLSSFISIFIFVLLLSWYKLLRRDPMSWPRGAKRPSRPATPNLLLYISAVALLYLSIKSFLVSRRRTARGGCPRAARAPHRVTTP